MNFSNIQSIDELLKQAAEKDDVQDAWYTLTLMHFVKEESEGKCIIIPGGDRTVDDYGTTVYQPDEIDEFYFKIVLKTSISLEQLAILLDDLEMIDATLAYDAMKSDSKRIPPAIFSVLVDVVKDGDTEYEIFNHARELMGNPYEEALNDSEFFQYVMSETDSELVVVPEINIDGETINIKLIGTSYDPDDVPDEIKIKL